MRVNVAILKDLCSLAPALEQTPSAKLRVNGNEEDSGKEIIAKSNQEQDD
jgi:hypothetical protein